MKPYESRQYCKDTPMTNTKIYKTSQLIYIIPNTHKHIIDNVLQSFNRYDKPKIVNKTEENIPDLIIISESHMFTNPDIEKIDDNNTQLILERQVLFNLHYIIH